MAFHHNQFPEIPFSLTISVIASGVSAANVVATMEIPSINQEEDLPPRKKPVCSLFLRLEINEIPNDMKRNVKRINRSANPNLAMIKTMKNANCNE